MSKRLSEMAIAIANGDDGGATLRRLSERETRSFIKALQRSGVRQPADVKLRTGIPQMIVPEASSPCGSPAALCAE